MPSSRSVSRQLYTYLSEDAGYRHRGSPLFLLWRWCRNIFEGTTATSLKTVPGRQRHVSQNGYHYLIGKKISPTDFLATSGSGYMNRRQIIGVIMDWSLSLEDTSRECWVDCRFWDCQRSNRPGTSCTVAVEACEAVCTHEEARIRTQYTHRTELDPHNSIRIKLPLSVCQFLYTEWWLQNTRQAIRGGYTSNGHSGPAINVPNLLHGWDTAGDSTFSHVIANKDKKRQICVAKCMIILEFTRAIQQPMYVTFMSDSTRTAGLGCVIAQVLFIGFSWRRPSEAQVRFEAENVEMGQVFWIMRCFPVNYHSTNDPNWSLPTIDAL